MNSRLRGLSVLLSVFALVVLSTPLVSLAGFGVSPPLIQEDRLVRGISFERVVYLVQGTPDRDVPIEVAVDSQIKDWITFPQGMPITIPAGVQQFPLVVRVEIPESAELGIYTGEIRITAQPERANESGEVAIALGGLVTLNLTVGEGIIYDFAVKQIKIEDIKEGSDPKATVQIVNKGNVPAGPDTVTFELFNKFGEIRLAYAETHSFKPVPAFTEGSSQLSFPMDIYLAPGEYWGHVKVYQDQKMIGELRTVFNVKEKTFFEAVLPYVIGLLVLVVLVIVGLVVRAYLRKRKATVMPPVPEEPIA
ncbi:MAG: hypothetical protein KBD05_00260 [Candidatus Pacebacteria bacterium]|nr:hypothetical protein [Candidatus Paceibacterota bacterium]